MTPTPHGAVAPQPPVAGSTHPDTGGKVRADTIRGKNGESVSEKTEINGSSHHAERVLTAPNKATSKRQSMKEGSDKGRLRKK